MLERPSSLVVFATVAGSAVIGLLLYAGLFYANARRSTSGPDTETVLPDYPSKKAAQDESERWIKEGGDFVVRTTQRIRRSVPLSKQERIKLEMLADERRRARIEADYAECLDSADNDLAKELCSFQQSSEPAQGSTTDSDGGKIPKTKIIEDVDVVTKNISPQTIKPLITPKTKAILPVHLTGRVAKENMHICRKLPSIQLCRTGH